MFPYLRIIPVSIIMGIIFLLSHQSGDLFAPYTFEWADKLAHLLIYAVLCATLIYAFGPQFRCVKKKVVVSVSLVACLVYGISDEFHQSFIPGRFPSFADITADVMGAVLVCLLWLRFGNKEQTD